MASSAATHSGLPDFAQPPVDETALSLQFAPIAGFSVPHFGLFWQKVRGEYPHVETHGPIANVIEQFGSTPAAGRQLGLSFVREPDLRCWYLDQSRTKLIQVQRDRFVHNWRKVSGTEAYPRYPSLRGAFEREWGRFCEFLRDEKLEQPKVDQCEVTYVNNIEYDKGWHGYGELDKVIASLSTPRSNSRFLPSPERVGMQVTYCFDGDEGRLHVAFSPVIRGRDGKEVLQMTLTARGAPKSASTEDVLTWLDLGRKWVVRGFADFTTSEIHKVWEKQ